MDATLYTKWITSQHADKPDYAATVEVSLQPVAEIVGLLNGIPSLYDIDNAVGAQLDTVGQWVGRTRYLAIPLEGVYFSFDTAGLGFDEGTWLGPFDPTTGLTALPDDAYRNLLRAKILANTWDGTVPGAYEAWNAVFGGRGYQVLIQDYGDMSMAYALLGAKPDAVTLALFTGGYLSMKPAGVQLLFYATQSVADTPIFGFDVDNDSIAGFDTGAFATLVLPS